MVTKGGQKAIDAKSALDDFLRTAAARASAREQVQRNQVALDKLSDLEAAGQEIGEGAEEAAERLTRSAAQLESQDRRLRTQARAVAREMVRQRATLGRRAEKEADKLAELEGAGLLEVLDLAAQMMIALAKVRQLRLPDEHHRPGTVLQLLAHLLDQHKEAFLETLKSHLKSEDAARAGRGLYRRLYEAQQKCAAARRDAEKSVEQLVSQALHSAGLNGQAAELTRLVMDAAESTDGE